MKLVTYNIQYAKGKDGRFDLGRIAGAVDGADVIALQEVERHWPRSGMADQPAELGALLPGYYWVYGPAFDIDASVRGGNGAITNRRRQFGTMLLAKTPVLWSRLHPLPKLGTASEFNMDMGALEGVIETGAGPIRVYSLHLSSVSGRERLAQIAHLHGIHACAPLTGGTWTGVADACDAAWTCDEPPPPMPGEAVWMGDFNAEPGGPEYDAIVGDADPLHGYVVQLDRFADAWVAAGNDVAGGVTYPAQGIIGDMRLDYCFVTPGLVPRVRRAWIDGEARGSDHQPTWTEIDV